MNLMQNPTAALTTTMSQGGRRQRNIGVAITNKKFAARLCLLHYLIPKYWYGKCHTGHTAGDLTDEHKSLYKIAHISVKIQNINILAILLRRLQVLTFVVYVMLHTSKLYEILHSDISTFKKVKASSLEPP